MADLGTAVLALYFRAKAVGDRLLARSGQSTASLGVLRSLALEGPQTVSQIARSRPVARQGVQRLADKLTKEGLTEENYTKIFEVARADQDLRKKILQMIGEERAKS